MDPVAGFIQWAITDFIPVWGYLGLFLIELVSAASIIFPAPAFVINFLLGAPEFGLNPWLVGIVAGVGSALGEITGYGVGRGSREFIQKKYGNQLKQAKKWMEEHGDFLIIILFAATPLPHDIVGMLAGAVKYDLKKFMLATMIGKIIIGIVLAWAGYYSIGFFVEVFNVG